MSKPLKTQEPQYIHLIQRGKDTREEVNDAIHDALKQTGVSIKELASRLNTPEGTIEYLLQTKEQSNTGNTPDLSVGFVGRVFAALDYELYLWAQAVYSKSKDKENENE